MDEATRGDGSFEAFYVESLPRFLRLARLLTGDRGRGEDLAQETYWRVHRAWSRLHDPKAAPAYTRTVMVRLAIRGRGRRWRGELPERGERLEALGGVALDPAHAAVDDTDAFDFLLSTLPASQRAVLVLRYFADLSEADIARVLHCRPGTVKSRATRAIDALRKSGLVVDEATAAPVSSPARTRTSQPSKLSASEEPSASLADPVGGHTDA